MREFGQCRFGNGSGESLNGVVARMHFQQQCSLGRDDFGEIFQVGAVGRSDFLEPAAGTRHDVRHAERAADLHQLAARHHDFLAQAQRVQGQEHGRGVVVDHGCRLGAGELAQQVFHERIAVAARPAVEIVFKVARPRHGVDHGSDGSFRQQRPPHIGVQYCAGQIEDRAQRWA